MVSCRNALIYMTPPLQSKIMAIFHFALKPDGLLLVGPSESAGASSGLFAVGDRKLNLFRRKVPQGKNGRQVSLPQFSVAGHVGAARRAAATGLKKMNPSQLRAELERVISRNVEMGTAESDVVPITIPKTGDKAYLVFGTPREEATGAAVTTPGKARNPELENARLQRELFRVKKSVKVIIEQQDAMNEELRSANEEIISSNEELQSTNEELETAKEELQASNEELATLNGELENRNVQLEQANVIAGHFKALVDSSDDAIITKDLNGIIQTWNKAAEKMFYYTAEEVIGKPVTILFPPDLLEEEPRILARLRAGQPIDHYETVRKRKDGTLLDISLTVSPVIDSSGQITSASKIARDITERKRSDTALKRARDEAEHANRIKDDFLATLSHELRTPLNPVLLVASEAAADSELSPGIRANFDIIRRNVELEARLIDDLLDLARVRTGKLKVERRLVNIHNVLTATVAIVQNEIEQKKITLTQELDDAQSVVAGDTVRLQQVFWNVLKNAIKFTPPRGEITIETSATREHCTVKISDTGIGMTQGELAHVFDPFKQGEHSEETHHRFGGLGLGLAITKNLVGLHSGTIEASSAGRGKGSSFTITLPLAEWNERNNKGVRVTEPGRAPAKLSGLRVLLVEDHDQTRLALEKLLTNRHHKVTTAGSVREAIAAGKKCTFDLVISDIGLPDGTGHELFKKLRKSCPKAKGIALTGYGMEKDVANSRESGFSAHLTKPVRIDALDAALASVLN
jgi:PAS domain S-box-containing protein